jgi:hypothetical protein
MTAPLRSKDIRGYALRINYRSDLLSLANVGKQTRGTATTRFFFSDSRYEHRLNSLHTTLNVSHRTGNIWTTIPDLARVIFARGAPAKK